MTSRTKSLQSLKNEPIAVIGLGCRFPGGIINMDTFWDVLSKGKDVIEKVPKDRWDLSSWYSEDKNDAGKMYTQWGGFIPEVYSFDPEFFGISPREAKSIDPQHRISLEITWEALEMAGYTKSELFDSDTGVYMGIYGNDYQYNSLKDTSLIGTHTFVGTLGSAASGRIAYWLGLKGPNMAIDTSCSSALVAVHNAVQALRNDECKMAIAGGVNLLLSPEFSVGLSKVNGLSPSGRSRAFSADADGFVRSEGAGVLVLKPLSKAKEDNDRIYGVISGSAVNQDGQSQGFTAPSRTSQKEVIEKALLSANLKPKDIDYVEAHGTGTKIGDITELNSLNDVFGELKNRNRPLYVGSVKTNIGHTEAASGIAGLIKTIVCMEKEALSKTIHFSEPNRKFPWEASSIKVVDQLIPWKRNENKTRYSSICSFGITGTNAHIILEEGPDYEAFDTLDKPNEEQWHVFPFSGHKKKVIDNKKRDLLEYMNQKEDVLIQDVAFTLINKKTHFSFREVLLAQNKKTFFETLKTTNFDDESPTLVRSILNGRKSKTVFLFTGGGAQFSGMGKDLYKNEPLFRKYIDESANLSKEYLSIDLRDVLFSEEYEKYLHRIDYMQPALFAFEYAMFKLMSSWGITPDFLMGHSLGEIVAACVADVFSFEEGIKLICTRGKLMQSLPNNEGMMASIEATEEDVLSELENLGKNKVSIGVINGAFQTVVSGDSNQVQFLVEKFQKNGAKTKILKVSHASHSPMMLPIVSQFKEVLETIEFKKPKYSLVSNLNGEIIEGEMIDTKYWVNHLLQTVRFSDGIKQLENQHVNTFIELGPSPVLLGILGISIEDYESKVWLPTSREDSSILPYKAISQWYVENNEVNWTNFTKDHGHYIVTPSYPFQKEPFQLEVNRNSLKQTGELTDQILLQKRLKIADHWIYESEIDINNFQYLNDHQVLGQAILPASYFCELIFEFMRIELKKEFTINDLVVTNPFQLKERKFFTQLIVKDKGKNEFEFNIYGKNDPQEDWSNSCRGTLALSLDNNNINSHSLNTGDKESPKTSGAKYYKKLEEKGIKYGPSFRGIKEIIFNEEGISAQIQLPEFANDRNYNYQFDPILLDCAFHALISLINEDDLDHLYLFHSFENFRFLQGLTSKNIWIKALINEDNSSDNFFSIRLDIWDEYGVQIAHVDSVYLAKVHKSKMLLNFKEDWNYNLTWEPFVEVGSGNLNLKENWLCFGEGATLESIKEQFANEGINILGIENWKDFESLNDQIEIHKAVIVWPANESHDILNQTLEYTKQGLTILNDLNAYSEIPNKVLSKIYWITFNAQAFSLKKEIDITKAPLWGMGNTFITEHPDLSLTMIDVELGKKDEQLLKTLLLSNSKENRIAIRDNKPYTLHLEKSKKISTSNNLLFTQKKSTILITGGLKGIGLLSAEWISEKYGIENMILIGRSDPNEEVVDRIEALREKGITINISKGDVTDLEFLKKTIDTIPADLPLKGVIHSAGVTNAMALKDQNESQFIADMSAKVEGAWYLHELTKSKNLEAFVVYSSAASVMDVLARGQASYVAANTFLDSLVDFRNQLGMNTFGVNWSPWESIGMAADFKDKEKNRLRSFGFVNIIPKQGFEILERILSSKPNRYPVLSINFKTFENYLNSSEIPTYYSLLVSKEELVKEQAEFSTKLLSSLKEVDIEERNNLLIDIIKKEVSIILSFSNERNVNSNKSLFTQGFDSLMAVELKNRLTKILQTQLPVVLVLKNPQINKLSEVIVNEYLFQETKISKDQEVTLAKVSLKDDRKIPLSSMQERMWFVYKLTNKPELYNIFYGLEFHGVLDIDILKRTLSYLSERHELLRSSVDESQERGLKLQIRDKWTPQIVENDLSDEKNIASALEFLESTLMNYQFDFSEPALHFEVVKLKETQYKLMITQHHLFADGWSIISLMKEIIKVYDAFDSGKDPMLNPVTRSYEEFVQKEGEKLKGNHFTEDLIYWKNYLKDAPQLKLPVDHLYPARRSYSGGNIDFEISEKQKIAIEELMSLEGFTLNSILFGTYALLIHFISNQNDFVIGSGMANRNESGYENVFGYFANTVALRCQIEEDMTIKEYLNSISNIIFNSLPHHEVPFNEVVKSVLTSRNNQGNLDNPLFNVSYVLNGFDLSELYSNTSEWVYKGLNMGIDGIATDDLNLIMVRDKKGLKATLNYNLDIFNDDTALGYIELYKLILNAFTTNFHVKIKDLNFFGPTSKSFNLNHDERALKSPVFNKKTVIDIFHDQVSKTPDALALSSGDVILTYAQLKEKSDRLSNHMLNEFNITPSSRVGIMMERSEWSIISILAVLKLGAAYVPIDESYPEYRKEFIVQDTEIDLLITNSLNISAEQQIFKVPYIELSNSFSIFDEKEKSCPTINKSTSTDLAYIMYTSGSSGKPKGVRVSHRSIVNLIVNDSFDFLGKDTVMYHYAPFTFDASTFEIWGVLLTGGKLVVSSSEKKTIEAIGREIQSNKVNTLWLTASLFHMAAIQAPDIFESIKYLLAGGESIRPDLVTKLLKNNKELTFINGYGPTECTTFAAIHKVNFKDELSVTRNIIGMPISGVEVYVGSVGNNNEVNIKPVSVTGELLIGGNGLALGYLNDEVLTNEKFIKNPFSKEKEAKLYRTGDQVRRLADGKLEFLGRLDDQVKVRGYRIELGEVENLINECKSITQSKVLAIKDPTGSNRLAAYVVTNEVFNYQKIRDQISDKMPEFMVPSLIKPLDSLPLNLNGKIDKKALVALLDDSKKDTENELNKPVYSIESKMLS
ncbi:MAG: amino acid adenylation domain-containing protein, partial [Flavobacteriaceae bacterium]